MIDECESFDELLDKLEQMGYTIKKTEKNIAFKHKDQEKNPHSRFLWMSSLGRDYTEEDLRERLYTEYAEAEEEYDTCEAAIHNIDVFLNRNKKDNEQGDEDRNADRHEPQPKKGQEI